MFSIETQGANTFLVYQLTDKDQLDTLSLGMITNNKINGIIPVLFTQQDKDKYIKYNISAKISVKQFFEGQVNRKRLLGVFASIASTLILAEEYMLDTNSFLLDLEYIYADVTTCNASLVCLPFMDVDKSMDMITFFKNIVFSLQFDQSENCDYVTKIFNYLNSTTTFSLNEFKKIMDELINEPTASVASTLQQPIVSVAQQPQAQIQPQPQPNPQPQSQMIKRPYHNPPVPPVVPGKQQDKKSKGKTKENSGENQDKMSWFYLMSNYNKENAAIYKEQKKNKKNSSNSAKAPKHTNNKQAKKSNQAQANFAVPGMQPPPTTLGQTLDSTPPVQTVTSQANLQQSASQPQPQLQQTPPATPVYTNTNTANYGETTVLGSGNIGETTVLSQTQANVNIPHLVRQKNNERIQINKPVIRVGKEKSFVDCFIGDNPSISRSHANIITRDGEYFVVDTNSTNHTYVNGEMIRGNEEVKIMHGARIRFADEEFEFKQY